MDALRSDQTGESFCLSVFEISFAPRIKSFISLQEVFGLVLTRQRAWMRRGEQQHTFTHFREYSLNQCLIYI